MVALLGQLEEIYQALDQVLEHLVLKLQVLYLEDLQVDLRMMEFQQQMNIMVRLGQQEVL